jgi:hypothetical protein
MGSTFSIQFNFISGSTTLNPSVPGTMTFFGFQSSATDIQSLVITGTGSGFGFALDNFTFTAASGGTGVPEPASAGLILLGLSLGLLAFRKNLRRRLLVGGDPQLVDQESAGITVRVAVNREARPVPRGHRKRRIVLEGQDSVEVHPEPVLR